MKPSITIIFISVMLLIGICFTSGEEIDLYADFIAMRNAVGSAFSTMGNSIISMGRILNYGWLRSGNYLCNFAFSLNYKDAEYFFYKEQRPRDRKVDMMVNKNLKREMTYFEKKFVNGKPTFICRV